MSSADGPAVDALLQTMRTTAISQPATLSAYAKDIGVLVKLLRNPGQNPAEPKFRRVKLSNGTIARVLANAGVRDVLLACGFADDASSESLVLGDDVNEAVAAKLLSAAQALEAGQQVLLELQWVHAVRAEVPSLAAQPWVLDKAAPEVIQRCVVALAGQPESRDVAALGGEAAVRSYWVSRLHSALHTPEMRTCRATALKHASVLIKSLRELTLDLIHAGALDVTTLAHANRCLATLWPPGDARTLPGRLEFCFDCLEAALPPDDEPMELRLRLRRDDLLGTTIESLGAFSEVGVRCGVLKQELIIEYRGEAGLDAGGLRRQFFDLFTSELKTSPLWACTAAGGLRPADAAAAGGGGAAAAAAAAAARAHMVTCGRVCGMALYQELHRRRGSVEEMIEGRAAPPNLLGAAFARYFIRAVQHDVPTSLAELQAELRAETLEAHPDYRAGGEILARSVAESGLQDATFVRAVGDVEVPLVAGGEAIAVTDSNVREWLERLLRSELVESFAEAAADFRQGLLDVIGVGRVDGRHAEMSRWTTPHFFMLTAEELQVQWSGAPVSATCIEELKRVAVVHVDVEAQAGWLWEVMHALDDAQRTKFFRFVTGSSRRPPEGIADFRIGPKAGGDGAFPFAHACANALDMPSYSSKEILRRQLEAAVEAAHDKFTDL